MRRRRRRRVWVRVRVTCTRDNGGDHGQTHSNERESNNKCRLRCGWAQIWWTKPVRGCASQILHIVPTLTLEPPSTHPQPISTHTTMCPSAFERTPRFFDHHHHLIVVIADANLFNRRRDARRSSTLVLAPVTKYRTQTTSTTSTKISLAYMFLFCVRRDRMNRIGVWSGPIIFAYATLLNWHYVRTGVVSELVGRWESGRRTRMDVMAVLCEPTNSSFKRHKVHINTKSWIVQSIHK